jgi:hypothetical protein
MISATTIKDQFFFRQIHIPTRIQGLILGPRFTMGPLMLVTRVLGTHIPLQFKMIAQNGYIYKRKHV